MSPYGCFVVLLQETLSMSPYGCFVVLLQETCHMDVLLFY
jgi:hypothetical protein